MSSNMSPSLPPTNDYSRRNQVIATAILWLDGEGNQQLKRQKRGTKLALACSAQPGGPTQGTVPSIM